MKNMGPVKSYASAERFPVTSLDSFIVVLNISENSVN